MECRVPANAAACACADKQHGAQLRSARRTVTAQTSMTVCTTLLAVICGCLIALPAAGQYFGKNTVRWETFDFRVLETEHFDIYYYDALEEHIETAGQLAERWNRRLVSVLNHRLTSRQPIILYATHPHFRQTNTSPADIGEGTGGFTEIFRNRVVLPFAGTWGDTDHVLGHELVHAFQFDMTGGETDPERFGNIPGAIRLPLWLVEGMAEYLSIGPHDSHTTMFMRDLLMRKESLSPAELNQPILFQPYRHGHALLAYIGGRFGDAAIGPLLVEAAAAQRNINAIFEPVLGIDLETLLDEWMASARSQHEAAIEAGQATEDVGRVLRPGRADELPAMNLGPALSPDGSRLIFLGQPDRLSIEVLLMDVETGEIITRITRSVLEPHLEALQFVRSAGSWRADGDRFVFSTIRRGRPALEIVDGETGSRIATHRLEALDEIYNPVWSPDGRRIAFSAMHNGMSDLFAFDLEARELERLTDDRHSALQPAWAPNGDRIAFVTDRFTEVPDTLAPRRQTLALLDPATGQVESLPSIPEAKAVDPNWSRDGASIYFLSDPRGTSNIYRLDLDSGEIRELTNVKTGVSGLTGISSALSVNGPRDAMAFSMLEGGGFSLVLTEDGAGITGTPIEEIDHGRHLAQLAPAERRGELIATYLEEEPGIGLVEDPVVSRRPYQADISPEFISQANIAGGSGEFGTFIGGGVALFWSDMLGNHNLLTQLQIAVENGEVIRNTAAVLGYTNREQRFDWGGILSQVPLTSAGFSQAIGEIEGEPVLVQDVTRSWEINRNAVGRFSYPLSRANRFEVAGGFRQLSFDAETDRRIFSLATGAVLDRTTEDIPTPSSLTLGTLTGAMVHDTSVIGGTAPVLGRRTRVELTGVTGSIDYVEPLADYRQYFMPFDQFPVTLAGRAMHFGRYGPDAEDPRLRPLFLGSPGLIRGYPTGFRLFTDPGFQRMQGSRIAVANAEVRIPLAGVRGFVGGPFFPPIEGHAFFDAGVAWDSDVSPSIFGGDRGGITSVGVGIRTNLAGLVLEFVYVNPRQFDDRGWHFQFNLIPGF